MKHKLLSLLALAGAMCLSTNAWAQDEEPVKTSKWEDPVKPEAPTRAAYDGTWVTPEAGKTYYIYNVGAVQFMGMGRDWGTRTVTTNDSIVSPTGSKAAHKANSNFATPIALTTTTDGYFYFSPQNTDLGGGPYITGEGNASWTDGDTGRAGKWQVIAKEDGENEFLLHCANEAPYDGSAYVPDDPATEDVDESADNDIAKYRLLGVTDANDSYAYTWNDAHIGDNGAGVDYQVGWKFAEATDDVATAIRAWRDSPEFIALQEAYQVAIAIYNAKVVLHATLDAADEAGVAEADINAAVAVYQNEAATEAEVLAANTALQLAITLAGAELPADITSVLQNPDFEYRKDNGDLIDNGVLPPGWDITITGINLGQQNRTDTNPETGLAITNFIEAWHPSALGNGVIAQTVYGLPAGRYRLECDASICHDPANGDGSDIVGAGLFIQSGVLRATTPIGTPRLGVAHFEVEFDNDGGKPMTFGLYAEDTNANWLSADNFQLFYLGELTESPHYTQLKNYLDEVTNNYSEQDTYCAAAAKSQLNAAIDAANALLDAGTASDDQYDAAYTALQEALAAVNASAKVYATLEAYIKAGGILDEYAEKTADNDWIALSSQLSDLKVDWETAYTDGTFTDEQITEAINSIQGIIIDWMNENPDAVKEGNDLTLLLQNADFEDGKYHAGWDAADDEVQPDKDYGTIPGWTISSGNITQMSHVIETYHRKFDFNQTIKNMPAGVYDITVQGFVRHDGSATDQTIFYAGDLETQLMQRSDQWNYDGFYNDGDGKGDPCGGANKDQSITNSLGETVKVPNGMSGFYWWEQEENTEGAEMDYAKWQEGDKYYTNHIKAVLKEAGDLTIGLRSIGTTDWIIWDNFQIKYLGQDANLYAEMAADKLAELTKVYESEANKNYLTDQARNDYQTISDFNYTDISDLDGYNDYAAKCDALIAYIQEGTKLGTALETLLNDYSNRITAVSDQGIDAEDFNSGILTDMYAKLEDLEFADNAELEAAPNTLALAWTKCIMDGATEGTFGNVTAVIYNPDYVDYANNETSSLNGWTTEKADDWTFGNNRAADGVAETWLPKGEFTNKQQIVGLSEGYYRLTVNGWYSFYSGYTADEYEKWSTESRIYMFGESSEGRFTQPLKNRLAYGEAEATGMEGEASFNYNDAEGNEATVYFPGTCAGAANYFQNVYAEIEPTELVGEDENVSTYRNSLNVQVGADGVLTIGISNVGTYVQDENNDWAVFANWTLSYLGEEAPDGIAAVNANTQAAPAVIYTIDGRQASRLQRGLNIVRTAEGHVQKVLVK